MNSLEEINLSEGYTHVSEYYADVADPRYKQMPEWREACDRKLARSTSLRSTLPQATGRTQMAVRARIDGNGNVQITQDIHSLPPNQVRPEADKFETLTGGALRFSMGFNGAAVNHKREGKK